MINGIYTSALGAIGQTVKIDVISNNLANLDTPGFRRDYINWVERLPETQEDLEEAFYYNALADRYGGAPFVSEIPFSREPGGYESTERPLDFAIGTEGYFGLQEVSTGNRYYTRAGNFIINAEGYLVTTDGRFRALNANLEPINIPGDVTDIILDPDTHQLRSGDQVFDALGVFEVDESTVRKYGFTAFRAQGEATPMAGARVYQGKLEGSNVNPIIEMGDLIAASRVVEANLNMIRFQDSSLDRLVNEFGRIG